MKRDMSVVGIDIAKRVFHLVGMDERGKIVMRKRCSRSVVLPLLANLGPTTSGMEACGGAHYWARYLRAQGRRCVGQGRKPIGVASEYRDCWTGVERSITVSHEAIRQWYRQLGQEYANRLRRRRPQPGDKWHLDEVFLTINGECHYLWRAIDQDDNVLDILV
jgi:DDE superfamily endonuclease